MADPYVYPKTNILINKAGIKEQKKLEDFENTIVNLSLIKLFKEDFIVKSVYDIFIIHKKIFEEVYDWAGEPRIINIIKQEVVLNGLCVEYCDHELIQHELNKLDVEFFKIAKPNLNKADFIKNISKAIASLWKIHPFYRREYSSSRNFFIFFC
jgi:cell filamentation protein